MGTLILGAVVVAVLWGTLFSVLSVDWSTNPQYGCGWFMPLLTTGLFWKRWQVRAAR